MCSKMLKAAFFFFFVIVIVFFVIVKTENRSTVLLEKIQHTIKYFTVMEKNKQMGPNET